MSDRGHREKKKPPKLLRNSFIEYTAVGMVSLYSHTCMHEPVSYHKDFILLVSEKG